MDELRWRDGRVDSGARGTLMREGDGLNPAQYKKHFFPQKKKLLRQKSKNKL